MTKSKSPKPTQAKKAATSKKAAKHASKKAVKTATKSILAQYKIAIKR